MMKAFIFIPGYKGSFLKKPGSSRVWITMKSVFSGRDNLALEINGTQVSDPEHLVPDGVMTRVPVIPFIASKNFYGNWLDVLTGRNSPDIRVIPFAYDWRRDLHEHVTRLSDLVRELRTGGIRDISIISHSLGGLIAAWYLRYGNASPQNAVETWEGASAICKWITAGTPFHGSLTCINYHAGEAVICNRRLLGPDVFHTFPVAYQLLPGPGCGSVFNARTGHKLDLWDIETWTGTGIGYYGTAGSGNHLAFLDHNLENSGIFFRKLHLKPDNPTPDTLSVLNLAGCGHQTHCAMGLAPANGRAAVVIDTNRKKRKYPALAGIELFEDGDGTVSLKSAQLPLAWSSAKNCSFLKVPTGHRDLFTDKVCQKTVLEFLKI